MRTLALMLVFTLPAAAQPPVAPTPRSGGDPNGRNISNYNIIDNVELGYRFLAADGNVAQYRSSVNFGNGIRLLGSSLAVNSRNGHGALFDQIVLTTQGLGNDPYQSTALHIEKNRLYRYDMSWRQNDYFNPGLVTAGGEGQNLLNTRYRMQDHNLTLFPQSNLKFFLGMTASSQAGAAYSSIPLFAGHDTLFPLFSDVRRVWREYRVGNEFRLLGIRVNWMRGWEDFKDDTGPVLATTSASGAAPVVPASGTSLTSFRTSDPYHGTNPYWRAALFTEHQRLSVNGRFTYTAGRRAFVVDENAMGTVSNLGRVQNVITFGDARRPVATGNLNLNFTPNSKVTVANSTSVYNVRTLGNSFFSQFDTPSQTAVVLYYDYLGLRTVANDTNVNYQVSPAWGLMGGYHYSSRLIRSNEQFTFQGAATNIPAEQTNQLHSADFGVRFKPWKPLTAQLSAEIGTNSRPFTPQADRNYHVLNGRLQYRTRALQVTAAANANYNVNSVSLSSYGSQSRTYAINGAWTPNEHVSFDAGFTRLHLYTIGGIAYFLNQQLASGQSSVYLSNINSSYVGARVNIKRRVDLYAGYTRVQDVGDGRANPFGAGLGSPVPIFQAVQTFPIAFQSPVARVSVVITGKLLWNAGYQYYGYRQDFTALQNYRANTGYTSLSLSF